MLMLAAVVVIATQARDVRAQQSGPLFTERFANVFDPNSHTYFSVQGTEGKQFGGQQPFASIGATHYVGSIDSAVTLYSGQFMMNYNSITGIPAGSLGVQQRWLTDLPVLDRSILGAGLYVDFTQSRYNNVFQQVDLNFELFTQSAWVSRGNIYLPIGGNQQGTGIGSSGNLTVIDTVIGTGANYQLLDVAMMGTDWELGRKFFNYRAEVYGGYYNWNGPVAGFTNGVKGGVRAYLTNNLSGNVNISHDQFFGTNVWSGLTYFFGGNGGSRPMTFENLMTLPAQRSQQVAIQNYSRGSYAFTPLHDSSGDLLHAYFVKEGGTGTGTQADPASIASVLANTEFGHGSAMILVDAGGNFTTPIALTQDRQQIIGGGATGTANVDFSVALGQAPGSSFLHLAGLGGRPVLAPTSGDAVTLTNQNTVQGFTIDGAGGLTNGISGNPGAIDTTIRDMVIKNVAGTGILIQPSTNTTIDSITFSGNGTDVLLDAANSKITNITSTGAKNGSLNIGGTAGDITGTTTIANVNIQNAGGFGGIQLNNAQNGAKINLTNVIVGGGTGSGITVNNSQTGSIYTLTNVDILTVGGTGMSLVNSNGLFNVDATSLINNAGSTGLVVNGGAIDVNYGGGLGQTVSAQSAVLVTGNHTGSVIFTNTSSLNTTIGDGLQFNGADGTYKFLGTTTMNGGDAGIDIFNSNGDFTFKNPYINNTASGMGVKIVGGGGDAPITTFNGLDITTTSNQGFFVSNGGLTTVNGTANVHTSTGTAVELNGTSLAAVFTNITSTGSPGAGISIDNSSGTFGVTGLATVTGAAGTGIVINNSKNLTSTIKSVTIDTVGTGLADNGVLLTDAGSVSIQGGTINNSTGDGIHSSDTNLTINGINIGGTGSIAGDGIEVINNGLPHTVSITNSTIKGMASGLSTKDSGNSGELLLTLNGNTFQSVNGGSQALAIIGNGQDSTIIKSMLNGTIIGGNAEFKRVTFDASGLALTHTQVNAGNWTIGTTANRVQGDALRFDGPTGDLKFGTLNIANNNGTGLYVDTKTLGTTFTLTNTAGVIDTTNGSATFLDPLTLHMTFSSITSTNSPTNGVTLDGAAGTFAVTGLTSVNGATTYGLDIKNSSATVNFNNVTVNTAGTNWIHQNNNTGAVNFNGTVTVDGVVIP